MSTKATFVNSERAGTKSLAHITGKLVVCVAAGASLIAAAAPASAQGFRSQQVVLGQSVEPLDMAVGRSIPMTTADVIQRVSLANPSIADVIVITERELVLNATAPGITDLIIWLEGGTKVHYRVQVHSPTDRKQVVLEVRIAEIDRSLLREWGVSLLWNDQHSRVGTGEFATRGAGTLSDVGQFATLLSADDIDNLFGRLDLNQQDGDFRILAQPNLIAANGEPASFLAGGEIPIPVAQSLGAGGVPTITIEYREFGIRLSFVPEILSDQLVKLKVEPEVSNLDFSNAVTISGFEIPALRVRRASTTLDLLQGQTLALAGLLQDQREEVETGVPLLKEVPILGMLFSSKRFQNRETELLILVTPRVIDPLSPPPPPPLPGVEEEGEGL